QARFKKTLNTVVQPPPPQIGQFVEPKTIPSDMSVTMKAEDEDVPGVGDLYETRQDTTPVSGGTAMPAALLDWSRPHFRQPGGKPFLFYVVYGRFADLAALSASKYRSVGILSGMDLAHSDNAQQPNVLAGF